MRDGGADFGNDGGVSSSSGGKVAGNGGGFFFRIILTWAQRMGFQKLSLDFFRCLVSVLRLDFPPSILLYMPSWLMIFLIVLLESVDIITCI